MIAEFLVGRNAFQAQTPWGPWSAFFMAVAFFVFQLVVAVVLGIGLVLSLVGSKVFAGHIEPQEVGLLIDVGIISLALSYVATIGFVIFTANLRHGDNSGVLLLKRPVGFIANTIFGIVVVALFMAALTMVMDAFFQHDAAQSQEQLKAVFQLIRQSAFLWLGVAIVVVGAPVLEELIFRGFLLTSFSQTRLRFWGAATLSSAMWALMHGYAASLAVGLFVFGLLLSWLVRRSGSIWVPIILHGLWNGFVTWGTFQAMTV